MIRRAAMFVPPGEQTAMRPGLAANCWNNRLPALLIVLALVLMLPGCLVIRTTEHRVKIYEDGSGEALLKLIDVRSDGVTDSAVVHDFEVMMSSFETGGVTDFEKPGRKVMDKLMYTRGDTLIAEISYAFRSLDALEGLRITPDEMYVVVSSEREIVRTNGRIKPGDDNTRKISWKRGATQISYVIRERQVPPSVPLGTYYQKYKMR
jgi:hypothetical protein